MSEIVQVISVEELKERMLKQRIYHPDPLQGCSPKEKMQFWFKRKGGPEPGKRVFFCNVWECLSAPGTLEALSANPKEWLSFSEFMDRRLELYDATYFLEFLFENRTRIPRQELARAWNIWLWDCRGYPRKSFAEDSMRDNLMFIDNEFNCDDYCYLQKPGWEMLRYILCDSRWSRMSYRSARKHKIFRMGESLKIAFREDDAAAFAISLDLSGKKISYSLLWEVLYAGATEVFRFLLENDRIPEKVISFPELCCFLVARFPERAAILMLKAIEEHKPGTVGAVHDALGRNLLWYAIYNTETLWFGDSYEQGLPHFLLEHGCDPENANQVGFTWRELCEALTDKQKAYFYKNCSLVCGYSQSAGWRAWWEAQYPRHRKSKKP
jgi:hypothetical protein